MSNWDSRRWAALIVHIVFAAIPFLASTAAAFNWWIERFGVDQWGFAAVAVGTVEILALSSLILYIIKIEWPLTWLRHMLPFISILPLGWTLYELLEPRSPMGSILIAVGASCWLVYLSFQLFRSLEGLFIDPVTAMREKTAREMVTLATTLASYQVASRSVNDFALQVLDPHTITTVPTPLIEQPKALTATQPILQTSEDAHPRMLEIAMLAGKRASDGAWLYTLDEIRAHVRVDPIVIGVVAKLVRGGHMAVAEEVTDANR